MEAICSRCLLRATWDSASWGSLRRLSEVDASCQSVLRALSGHSSFRAYRRQYLCIWRRTRRQTQPHIGLATVTYLFEGAITHRYSVGSLQAILPGDINWKAAGRRIVHSDLTRDTARPSGHAVNGLPTWVALPFEHEHAAPTFSHQPAASLLTFERDGVPCECLLEPLSGLHRRSRYSRQRSST